MIEWNAGSWIVRDPRGHEPDAAPRCFRRAQILAGQIRIASGQLVMGDVLLTLYPDRRLTSSTEAATRSAGTPGPAVARTRPAIAAAI